MTEHGASCRTPHTSLGGLSAADFSAFDVLAVKLHCLDRRFAEPLRQIGVVFGERMASEQASRLSSDEALSRMLSACGFPSSLESRFLELTPDRARLQVTGCGEACCPIPPMGRQACGFNAGVFEGFLRGATGGAWSIEETACLGLGDSSCEFLIELNGASNTPKGGTHVSR